jgi:hypothetical protein
MKRIVLGLFFVFLVSGSLCGNELSLLLGIGNSDFTWNRKPDDTGIPPEEYFFSFSLNGLHSFDNSFGLGYSVQRDPFLRHLAEVRFTHTGDLLKFSVGPYSGLLNSRQRPVSPGVAGSVQLEIFSIGHVFLETYRPFLTGLSRNGDYFQAQDQISLRFYVPNIITGLNWHSRRYHEQRNGFLARYITTLYSLTTDIHAKNVPYRILLLFGYEDTYLEFADSKNDGTHSVGALVLGNQLTFELSPEIRYIIDLQSTIYSFGKYELLGEGSGDQYAFTVKTGISLTPETWNKDTQ